MLIYCKSGILIQTNEGWTQPTMAIFKEGCSWIRIQKCTARSIGKDRRNTTNEWQVSRGVNTYPWKYLHLSFEKGNTKKKSATKKDKILDPSEKV